MQQEGFKSLTVWKKSMELVVQVYIVVALLPQEEKYALSDQMRRSAVSIASNIAEGSKRGKKEFSHFLRVAHGSLAELETQLILTERLFPDISTESCLNLGEEVGKMLYALGLKLGD